MMSSSCLLVIVVRRSSWRACSSLSVFVSLANARGHCAGSVHLMASIVSLQAKVFNII
jgi:hypothetical protein